MTNFFKYLIVLSVIVLGWTGYKSYVVVDGDFMGAIKVIWPLLLFITVVLLLLLPAVMYLYEAIFNEGLKTANEKKKAAEDNAHRTRLDSMNKINEIKTKAEAAIGAAHKKERIAARNELDAEWASFHEQKNNVLLRENSIQERERAARSLAEDARMDSENSASEIAIMRKEFNDEAERLRKSAHNATQAYLRYRKKHPKKPAK